MGDLDNGDRIVRQPLHLLFVIDKSGSMEGENIASVNNAIRDVMAVMPSIQDDAPTAEILINALVFSDDAEWKFSESQPIDNFKWADVDAYGGTDFALVYEKLYEYLLKKSRGGRMPDYGGIAPIILFMTDGMPTSTNHIEKLNILKSRGWFKVALKYGIAIGEIEDEGMQNLMDFTGNKETVLKVYTAEALRKVIKAVAVTASKIKSSMAGAGPTTANDNSQEAVNVALKSDDDLMDDPNIETNW